MRYSFSKTVGELEICIYEIQNTFSAHSCGGGDDCDRYIRKVNRMEPPRPRPEPDCDRKMRAGYAPRRDPVDIADQIFFACDSNGDDALTWTEVEVCEV